MNDEFELFSARATELHHKNAARHRREIVARAQARALPIASHDDATREHVQEAVQNGMTIAEFPTTREAAQSSPSFRQRKKLQSRRTRAT